MDTVCVSGAQRLTAINGKTLQGTVVYIYPGLVLNALRQSTVKHYPPVIVMNRQEAVLNALRQSTVKHDCR